MRDVVSADIEHFVRYWHYSGDEHLQLLNISLEALGTPDDTRDRFQRSIREPGNIEQPSVAFSLDLDDCVVGYVNFNRYSPRDTYGHFHLLDPSSRGKGLGRITFPLATELLFDLYPDERLIAQIRTRATASNRAVGLYVAVAETSYFSNPDGLAGEGLFHMRYIWRHDVPHLKERAEEQRQLLFTRAGAPQ